MEEHKQQESDCSTIRLGRIYHDIVPTQVNPRQKANIFSQLIFAWIIPLLYKGSKNGLKDDDLPKCLPDDESKILGDQLERNWRQEVLAHEMWGRSPSLRKALWKTIWPSAIVDGFICFCYIMLKSLIPLVLAQLLIELQKAQNPTVSSNTFNTTQFNDSTNFSSLLNDSEKRQTVKWQLKESANWLWFWHDIYILGSLLVVATFMGCFINHHVDQRQKRMGAKMRIACCSLIQRKTTKLSLKTARNISKIGHIVNLISNDVNRLDIGFVFAHYLWILPLQTVLIGYLIWQCLGYAAIIGVVVLLLQTIPVQMCLSSWTAKLRQRIAQRTDARICKMNELIRGIQVIKMYAWESCFRDMVKESRRQEIRETRKAAYLRSFYLSSMILPERLTLFITIVAAVKMGTFISADAIFSIANLYHVFQLVAGIFCPMAISFASEAFVSIERIEKFLMQPEKEYIERLSKPSHSSNALEIENVTAGWDVKPVLENVSLKVPKGKLCVIAGPVGSGKSSLLQIILGELNVDRGSVKVVDNISYASQETWLFNGTIKKNILFTLPFRQKHYQQVVEKCSLITDFQQLKYQDRTLVGDRGASLSGGQKARINLARAVYNEAELYVFDDPLSAVDANVGRNLYDEVIGPRGLLHNKTRILVTHQTQYINQEADVIVWVEDGRIRSGNWQTMCETINSGTLKEKIINGYNKNERFPKEEEKENSKYPETPKEYDALLNGEPEVRDIDEQQVSEDQGKGCVKAGVWWSYFRAGNSILGLIYIFLILLISQAICSGADYFVNIYTKIVFMDKHHERGDSPISEDSCLILYSVLIIAAVFMIIYRCYLFLKTCMHASKVLHDRMFGCILKATMRFFDTNNSGRILNRFSKDMGAIDESLPRFMSEFTHLALVMLGVLVVICIVNPVILIAVALVALIDLVIIKLYLRSSQDFKRLEGIHRSPIFSHVSATLSGLSTIRCRKSEITMIEEFDNLQDIHSAAFHLTLTSNTALGLWLDCVNVIILLNSVTFSPIIFGANYSGNVGLAITQAMMLTGMVQYGLRQLGEAFQQMTSVERILDYTKLEQEEFCGHVPPEKCWPNKGVIVYNNVNIRYHRDGQLVLKNLNFSIAPGWKVGIVGRTGAGKTSLISSLFRLFDCFTGTITIDGRDIRNIDLNKLRSSISIIPQEPVLFEGTIRYNLDPFNKYEDNEMWQAIRNVQLGQDLCLDSKVSEYGSNLSIGQRQLICLARALLGHNSILVMDEATANVDQNTDRLIQQTIIQNFSHCTVLTVAHRLKTVMKSDRIMVLDNGELKEFDMPYKLLQQPNSVLKQMVEAAGNEASWLIEMAKEYYNEKF